MKTVENWPVSRLKEYDRNPRKNDHAVDKVAAAIKEFGFRVPVLVKSDGSLIDGHLRLKAARKLGMETVPVLLADDMTDTQIKAFRLSVNKMSELAEWDEELLKLELLELEELDFDLELTGFSNEEIKKIVETPEVLKEKKIEIKPIKWTRILLSIPNGVEIEGIDLALKNIRKFGGQVDFGGN